MRRHLTTPLALAVSLLGGAAAHAEPDFAPFHAQFRAALQRQDALALAALTRLPFLFEGRAHARESFVRQVWPQLFSAALRRCLVQAPVLDDGPGQRQLFCRPYSFHFDARDGAWQLREFSADGEDAP